GMGIVNIETSSRNGNVIASFPALETDEIMMVTDQGKIIRTPLYDVRIAGRSTQGVTLFKVSENEHIVSVAQMAESDNEVSDEEGVNIIGNDEPNKVEQPLNTGDSAIPSPEEQKILTSEQDDVANKEETPDK
ncbi:MAG: DNA gyrase C-terminal beta-propeller domain-containing protein, partial [Sphingomonadales bacterium]